MARIVKVPTATDHGKPYEVRWSWYDTTATPAKRRFKKERFRTLAEAKARKREVEQSTADGNMLDYMAGKATFNEWAERWHRNKVQALKPSTARGYRSILDKSVLPALGAKRIRNISTGDVEDFILGLQERGLTPPTIRHHYVVLRSVLAYAARKKAIAINPARDAELPTDKSTGRIKPEQMFLTEQQVANLAAALDRTEPYPLMIRFMAYTGLRAAEVAGLNVGDLDLLRRTVTVRRTRTQVKGGWEVHVPKSGKTRKVPIMGTKLHADLSDYLAQHPHADDPEASLWPGRVNGGAERFKGAKGELTYDVPWGRDAFYKRQFKPALKAAGLPERTRLHDLRHTFASICNDKRVPAYRVAEWMGHANETITRTIYIHFYDYDTEQYRDVFDEPTAAPSTNVTKLRGREAG